MPLTDTQIRNAKAEGRPRKLSDGHGLYLLVSPSGLKSWRWKYRFGGKEGLKVLGRYPDMGLREARAKRDDMDRARRSGKDPAAKAQPVKAETFEEVALRWHRQNAPRWRPKHASVVLAHLKRDVFPLIGKKPIGEVKAREVLQLLRAVEDRGAIDQAHRLRQRIDAVFAMAIGEDLAETNPASMVGSALKPVVIGRYPALRKLDDARALILAVEEGPGDPVTKLASRFLAVTAARSEAMRYAEWGEIEAGRKQWRIPGAHMKGRKAQRENPDYEFLIPLPDEALAILEAVKAHTGNYRLIFGGTRDRNKPMSDATISAMYRRLPAFAGRHVPHGWRSTFSTIMNEWALEHGRPGDREVIDLMLAHERGGVEGIYNRALHLGRRRELAEIWARMLLGREQD